MIKRQKTLTKSTKKLLDSGESQVVDYKRNVKGLKVEDIVSFANSSEGGSILIGVDEQKKSGELTVGVIVGCDLKDGYEEAISSKAKEAKPPISINITFENLNDIPIIRVDIPSSNKKPHCADGGKYCIREGSTTRALEQSELLVMFIEQHESRFLSSYVKTTESIHHKLESLNDDIQLNAEKMIDAQSDVATDILDRMDGIVGTIDDLAAEVDNQSRSPEDMRRDEETERYLDNILTLARYNLNLLVGNTQKVSPEVVRKFKELYVNEKLGFVSFLIKDMSAQEFEDKHGIIWSDYLKRVYEGCIFKESLGIKLEEFKKIANQKFPKLCKEKA